MCEDPTSTSSSNKGCLSLKKNLVVIKKKKKKQSGDDDDDARKKNKAISLFEGKQQQQVKVKKGDDTAEVDKIMENGDDTKTCCEDRTLLEIICCIG